MIPGLNILNRALSLIQAQTVLYYQYVSRSLNEIGLEVVVYADPISIAGSFQPVQRSAYQQLGLDFQKSYYTFYTSNNVLDIERDKSSDQIVFNNKLYQCGSNADWLIQDGWVGVLCVYVQDVS